MSKGAWLGLACVALLVSSGCHDDRRFERHTPPPGQGALLVDNGAPNHLRVYIDSVRQDPDARRSRITSYDLDPGLYRLVLEERRTGRNARLDVDILADRNTVAIVDVDPDLPWLVVRIFFAR